MLDTGTAQRNTKPRYQPGDIIGAYLIESYLGMRTPGITSVPYRLHFYRVHCRFCGAAREIAQPQLHNHGKRSRGDRCDACKSRLRIYEVGLQAAFVTIIDREPLADGKHYRYRIRTGCCQSERWVDTQAVYQYLRGNAAACRKCSPSWRRDHAAGNPGISKTWEGYCDARVFHGLSKAWDALTRDKAASLTIA